MAAPAIHICASIDWICKHTIDGDVAGLVPAEAAASAKLQGKGQPFASEPEPNAAYRSELGEASKDGTNGIADGLVRMEADLTVVLTPRKTDWQTGAILRARPCCECHQATSLAAHAIQ